MLNGLERFRLVMDLMDRVPTLSAPRYARHGAVAA
jgi:hypothetical protein